MPPAGGWIVTQPDVPLGSYTFAACILFVFCNLILCCYPRFWLAVQELKKRPIREVPTRVQEIWEEFLAPGAPSAINVDSKSYDKTTQNIKDPGRYAFEDAQVRIICY